ncbi:MAG: general stress protein CsbD [Chitinophagaceae bacterium]
MELHLEKPWSFVKSKMMEHNTKLTEKDLIYEKGKEDELLARLSKMMGRSKQAIKEWIESLSHND